MSKLTSSVLILTENDRKWLAGLKVAVPEDCIWPVVGDCNHDIDWAALADPEARHD